MKSFLPEMDEEEPRLMLVDRELILSLSKDAIVLGNPHEGRVLDVTYSDEQIVEDGSRERGLIIRSKYHHKYRVGAIDIEPNDQLPLAIEALLDEYDKSNDTELRHDVIKNTTLIVCKTQKIRTARAFINMLLSEIGIQVTDSFTTIIKETLQKMMLEQFVTVRSMALQNEYRYVIDPDGDTELMIASLMTRARSVEHGGTRRVLSVASEGESGGTVVHSDGEHIIGSNTHNIAIFPYSKKKSGVGLESKKLVSIETLEKTRPFGTNGDSEKTYDSEKQRMARYLWVHGTVPAHAYNMAMLALEYTNHPVIRIPHGDALYFEMSTKLVPVDVQERGGDPIKNIMDAFGDLGQSINGALNGVAKAYNTAASNAAINALNANANSGTLYAKGGYLPHGTNLNAGHIVSGSITAPVPKNSPLEGRTGGIIMNSGAQDFMAAEAGHVFNEYDRLMAQRSLDMDKKTMDVLMNGVLGKNKRQRS